MKFVLFGYMVSLDISRVDSGNPLYWNKRKQRKLACAIDENIRGGYVNIKLMRIKALREHFGAERDGFGIMIPCLGIKEAKVLSELLWDENGYGKVA